MDEGGRVCGEGVEDVPTLLSRGGYDGSDAGGKMRAPAMVRKPPEIFILTFIIRRSRSAFVGEGDGEVSEESQTSPLNLCSRIKRLCPGRCGARPRAPIALASGGWFRWKASPRRTMAL